MKKIVSFVFAAFLMVAASVPSYAQLSGKTVTREFTDLESFTELNVSGNFAVVASCSDDHFVEITVSEEYEPYLSVSVDHGTLVVCYKKLPGKMRNMKDVVSEIKVSLPTLEGLTLSGVSTFRSNDKFNVGPRTFCLNQSGATNITSLDVSCRAFKLDMGGSSMLSMICHSSDAELSVAGSSKINAKLVATDVEINLSGASRVELEGSCDNLDLKGGGASNLNADSFEIDNADVRLSGTTKARIYVSHKLEVELSGMSSCRYRADRNLDLRTKDISRGATLKKIR